jgi:hypothetical protein
MYRALSESDGNVLGYYCSGKITQAEVKEVHREIRRVLDEHGKVRLLLHLGDLAIPELKAALEDLKLTPQYVKDVERLAVIGHESWHDWLAKATRLFTRGEVRYFDASDLDEAWRWVKDGAISNEYGSPSY